MSSAEKNTFFPHISHWGHVVNILIVENLQKKYGIYNKSMEFRANRRFSLNSKTKKPNPKTLGFLVLASWLHFLDVVLLAEALDASGCVYQLLLAGKEGVAGGANFHLYVLNRRAGLDHVPACAGNLGHLVFWMNLFFHSVLH